MKNGVNQRLERQPGLYEQLMMIGVAVDAEAALSVTAFCWANGMDVASVAFEVYKEGDNSD